MIVCLEQLGPVLKLTVKLLHDFTKKHCIKYLLHVFLALRKKIKIGPERGKIKNNCFSSGTRDS